MIEIDGSLGEGGGQIVRSALTMAIVTGEAIRIERIRARRSAPGLRPQHLKAAEAAAAICEGRLEGAQIGSERLVFHPGRLRPFSGRFDIGTAGATSLLLQTVALPLMRAESASQLTLCGGTHVPWSPSFHYLERQWLAWLRAMGAQIRIELQRPGFYPRGGGLMEAHIDPSSVLRPLVRTERGPLREIRLLSLSAGLPRRIAERQSRAASQILARCRAEIRTEILCLDSLSKGTMLLAEGVFESARAVFFSLGQRGKPAERVGAEAAEALLDFLRSDAPVEEHGADQLILPLALAQGESVFRTSTVTTHLQTNIRILHHFLPDRVRIERHPGGSATVHIRGEPGRKAP